MFAQRLAGKEPLDQPQGGGTDHYRVGRCQSLQPGGNVGRVAQSQLLLPPATAHGAHYYRPGMHANPHRQPHAAFLLQADVQRSHSLHDAQPSPSSPLRVVFVRLGIAKVHQQAVAQILRDIPIKALDHRRTSLLIGPHHVAPVFRVELPGQAGRVHQVTKQHGELPTLGLRRPRGYCSRGSLRH